jgi:hypothetical protein
MKSSNLKLSLISVALAGLLQCSLVWAGAAAPSSGNPGGSTGAGATSSTGAGATYGTVGNGAVTDGVSPNGATPGATPGPTGNPSPTTPVRPVVNPPTQPSTSTGQDVRQPSIPARKN